MAREVELDSKIEAAGQVRVEGKGAGGRRCLDYVELFRTWLGPVTEQHPTPELYEAETHVEAQQTVHRAP